MDDPATSTHRGWDAAEVRSRRATTSGEVVDIAGVPLLLLASDAARAAAMAELLDRLPASDRPPVASLAFMADAEESPARPPDDVHDDLAIWRGADQEPSDLVLEHASGLTVAVRGPHARMGGECDNLGIGFRRLFPLALCPVLAHHDRILLHAGGFLAPSGAFLALGPTGSGKSTLVLAAHRAGWPCLADDLVALRRHGQLEAHGIPRLLAAPADVLTTADDAAALPEDDRGRALVSNLPLAAGWFPVAGTVLVGHSTFSAGELHAVPGAEALPAAIGCFHSAIDPELLRRAFPYLGELSRIPAWRLLHAASPGDRLAAAAHHLKAASRRLGGRGGTLR